MRFIANFCLVVRDTRSRYTHTHTNSHMRCRLCSSSHAATQLWPIFRRNWHDDCCYSCCCYSDNSNSCCYGHISVKVVWPKDVGISLTTIRLKKICELFRTFTFYSPTEGRCVRWYFVYVVYIVYVLVDQSLGIISVEDTRQLRQQQNAAIMTYIK